MVLASTVCQSPVPVVSGNNVTLEVLAVTLDEGWPVWAWPVVKASDIARLTASVPPIFFMSLVFMFSCVPEPGLFWEDYAESVLEWVCHSAQPGFQFSPIPSFLAHPRQNETLPGDFTILSFEIFVFIFRLQQRPRCGGCVGH